jgi:hypothetical protein
MWNKLVMKVVEPVTHTRKLFIFVVAISALIFKSLSSEYVYLARSLKSFAEPKYEEPSLLETEFSDTTESVLQTFIVPEQADVGYTGPIRRYKLNTTAGEVSPFHECPPTVQAQVIQRKSQWILQTIDEKGQNKTVGGDELYVTYTEGASNSSSLASAIALVHDRKDGTYALDFSTTSMNPILSNLSETGTLVVNLQYTCGIGFMAQPSKNARKTGGACRVAWKKENVTQPPIREFIPPTDIDFSPYDLVISFGDSLMEGMVRDPGQGEYFRKNTSYRANIWQFLSLATLDKVRLRLDQFHAKELNASTNVALILGSSVWDILEMENIQGPEFKDHLEACRQFLEGARQKYPHAKIFWKSPSALHIHRVSASCFTRKSCNNRLRYMSNSRALYLYDQQKKMVQEMGIPFVDLFEAYYLSADWTMWSDGRHYVGEFNRKVLDWCYSDSRDETRMALTQ